MNVTIPELADWLKGFDDIAVFGHRAPDGDACGSCAAVTLALRALGKRACAYLPGSMPEFLRFLPGQDLVVADGDPPFAPKCALAVDVSAPDMLGDDRARQFHVHFSRIEYSAGGEKRHWTFAETQFGPEPQPLMELLAERKLQPVIICESAGTQAEDAGTMQQMYHAACKT